MIKNNEKIAVVKDLVDATTKKSNTFFEEHLSQNLIAINNYGFSIGKNTYIEHYTKWHHSFLFGNYNIYEIHIDKNRILFRVSFMVKHVGEYKSILATGKNICLDIKVNVVTDGIFISDVSTCCNETYILKQISPLCINMNEPKLTSHLNSDNKYRFYKITLFHLESLNIKLTFRQLECLSLWASGRSSSDIATTLGISKTTANHHLEHVRGAFLCSKKREVFEHIERMNIQSIINKCYDLIIN